MKVADVSKIQWYLGVNESGAPRPYTTSKDIEAVTFEIDDKYRAVVKLGEWIKKPCFYGHTYYCSECGSTESKTLLGNLFKYCPNCGAMMEEHNAYKRND